MSAATELLARELCVRAHSMVDVEIGGIQLTGGVIERACRKCMADAIDLLPRLTRSSSADLIAAAQYALAALTSHAHDQNDANCPSDPYSMIGCPACRGDSMRNIAADRLRDAIAATGAEGGQ